MTGAEERANAINEKLRHWRQGDVSRDDGFEFMHLADLACPHSRISQATVAEQGDTAQRGMATVTEEVAGVVMLTQTCDMVRSCLVRPFVEIAPLVQFDDVIVEQVRRLKRPAFAYVPALAEDGMVADLDRIMTVEKAVVASWIRTPGGVRTWRDGISHAQLRESV